jgi:hypothetical protein
MSSSKIPTIVSYKTLDANKIVGFSSPKVNARGGKNIRIVNKSDNKTLHIATPLMLTWGVNEFVDDKDNKSYTMSLQFPKEDYATPETTQFLESLKEFEAMLKRTAMENCKEWLNKPKISDEGMDLIWNPMLMYPKDPKTKDFDYTRPPCLRIKVPYYESRYDVEVFDPKGQPLFPNKDGALPQDIITKGIQTAVIIQSGGIWFANGKLGTTFKLLQAVVQPKESLRGRCHIQLEDTEREQLRTSAEKQVEQEESEDKAEVASAVVVDSDNEDEGDHQEVATKQTTGQKKVVVRRKKAE